MYGVINKLSGSTCVFQTLACLSLSLQRPFWSVFPGAYDKMLTWESSVFYPPFLISSFVNFLISVKLYFGVCDRPSCNVFLKHREIKDGGACCLSGYLAELSLGFLRLFINGTLVSQGFLISQLRRWVHVSLPFS